MTAKTPSKVSITLNEDFIKDAVLTALDDRGFHDIQREQLKFYFRVAPQEYTMEVEEEL